MTRILAGREHYYTLNLARIVEVSKTGNNPKKLADVIVAQIAAIPEEDRKNPVKAIYYTVYGLEPFLRELD